MMYVFIKIYYTKRIIYARICVYEREKYFFVLILCVSYYVCLHLFFIFIYFKKIKKYKYLHYHIIYIKYSIKKYISLSQRCNIFCTKVCTVFYKTKYGSSIHYISYTNLYISVLRLN